MILNHPGDFIYRLRRRGLRRTVSCDAADRLRGAALRVVRRVVLRVLRLTVILRPVRRVPVK